MHSFRSWGGWSPGIQAGKSYDYTLIATDICICWKCFGLYPALVVPSANNLKHASDHQRRWVRFFCFRKGLHPHCISDLQEKGSVRPGKFDVLITPLVFRKTEEQDGLGIKFIREQ